VLQETNRVLLENETGFSRNELSKLLADGYSVLDAGVAQGS